MILRIVPLVACGACGSLQCLCVTVTAGGAAMVDSAPAFVRDARVRTIIAGKPIIRGMAACAIQIKHACMENRITVAACTIGG